MIHAHDCDDDEWDHDPTPAEIEADLAARRLRYARREEMREAIERAKDGQFAHYMNRVRPQD